MNYLPEARPATLEGLLKKYGVLEAKQKLLSIEKAGDGNMNYVLRVKWDKGQCILKQSPPFVAKYPTIAAPSQRIFQEMAFFDLVSETSASKHFPKVLFVDRDEFLLCLEDFGQADDLSSLYAAGVEVPDDVAEQLGRICSEIHRCDASAAGIEKNAAMRALNHAHLFKLPLEKDAINLSEITDAPVEAAEEVKNDKDFCRKVASLGARYLSDNGKTLIHGDFYPGSWLLDKSGIVKIIDPEFSFLGEPEFDLGVCVAHFMLSRQTEDKIQLFVQSYRSAGNDFDEALVCQYAATEIMRRLIGLAQLPLEMPTSERAKLLTFSRKLIHQASLSCLLQ